MMSRIFRDFFVLRIFCHDLRYFLKFVIEKFPKFYFLGWFVFDWGVQKSRCVPSPRLDSTVWGWLSRGLSEQAQIRVRLGTTQTGKQQQSHVETQNVVSKKEASSRFAPSGKIFRFLLSLIQKQSSASRLSPYDAWCFPWRSFSPLKRIGHIDDTRVMKYPL